MDKFAIPGRAWHGYFVDLDHNVLVFSKSMKMQLKDFT